jgi:hypothetical protein
MCIAQSCCPLEALGTVLRSGHSCRGPQPQHGIQCLLQMKRVLVLSVREIQGTHEIWCFEPGRIHLPSAGHRGRSRRLTITRSLPLPGTRRRARLVIRCPMAELAAEYLAPGPCSSRCTKLQQGTMRDFVRCEWCLIARWADGPGRYTQTT